MERQQALEILQKYTKNKNLVNHGLAVEGSEQVMVLLTVHAGGEGGAIGEGPTAGQITSVTLVQLKAGNALGAEFLMIISKDIDCFGKRKIGHQTVPYQIIA